LEDLYDLAITQKWSNCTYFGLAPKLPVVQICKSLISLPRHDGMKSLVFKQMFSESARGLLAQQMNYLIEGEKPASEAHGGHFTVNDILEIGATFLLATVSNATTWTDFSRDTTRKGVKHKRLAKFIKYLSFDTKAFFQQVNNDIKQDIQPGGKAVLDETGWQWLGTHGGLVHIERKPHEDVFKVLTLCLTFSRIQRQDSSVFKSNFQNRPYCYHFIPDITAKHIGPYAALNQFEMILPKECSLVADAWFGMKSWMECHKSLSLTFALSPAQADGLWQLFGHGLEFKQYRTFSNGKIIVTLFKDAALVVTASTAFKFTNENPTVLTPFQALETNTSDPTIQLSESDIKLLLNVSLDGLKKIASMSGFSTGKHYCFKLK
jgi:hypothetical protein